MRDLKKKIQHFSGRIELNHVVSNSEPISVNVKRPKKYKFSKWIFYVKNHLFLSRISKEGNKTEK